MAGKLFPIKILIVLTLILPFPPALSAQQAEQQVAVLLSDSEQAYLRPVSAFSNDIGMEVRIYNLQGDIRRDPQLMDRLLASRPGLIFALGAKAAYAAKLWTRQHQEIPVIFAMVFNWQKYNLLEGQDNMAGIASEVTPGIQFLTLSMLVPTAHRIGVIYSQDHSKEIVTQAREAAAMLGLELPERRISSPAEFKGAYRQLSAQVDGFWLLNDPLTYTVENMDWVKERCIKDRLVCIGQGANLAEIGILLSVLPDMDNIGTQAASMARNIMQRGQLPKAIGVMEPLGTRILLNQRTAERIGIPLSTQALGMASEVVE